MKNRKLIKHIAAVSWHSFIVKLVYKLKGRCKHLIKLDQWYASSKTGHCCGHKMEEMPLRFANGIIRLEKLQISLVTYLMPPGRSSLLMDVARYYRATSKEISIGRIGAVSRHEYNLHPSGRFANSVMKQQSFH